MKLCAEVRLVLTQLERKICAVEIRCYGRLLGISYKENITNNEVRLRIAQVIRPHLDLQTIVKRRKLK